MADSRMTTGEGRWYASLGVMPASIFLGLVIALVTITLGQWPGMLALVAGVSELTAAIVAAYRDEPPPPSLAR